MLSLVCYTVSKCLANTLLMPLLILAAGPLLLHLDETQVHEAEGCANLGHGNFAKGGVLR